MNKIESRTIDWLLLLIVLGAWGLLLLLPVPLPNGTPTPLHTPAEVPGPPPPDLTNCTRLEIRYLPSTFDFVTKGGRYACLLDTTEQERLRSAEIITVSNVEQIRAISNRIAQASYQYVSKYSESSVAPHAHIICYEGEQRVATLKLKEWATLVTEEGDGFLYSLKTFYLSRLAPELASSVLRCQCAGKLERLYESNDIGIVTGPDGAYADPNEWCTEVVTESGFLKFAGVCYDKEDVGRFARHALSCPSAGEGECHYAMNPNCGPDSAGDMVLLFETKAGWNQYGGPDLFTFDNHDPRGGCVLLNDGTVKFIRTEEELHALRWK